MQVCRVEFDRLAERIQVTDELFQICHWLLLGSTRRASYPLRVSAHHKIKRPRCIGRTGAFAEEPWTLIPHPDSRGLGFSKHSTCCKDVCSPRRSLLEAAVLCRGRNVTNNNYGQSLLA